MVCVMEDCLEQFEVWEADGDERTDLEEAPSATSGGRGSGRLSQ